MSNEITWPRRGADWQKPPLTLSGAPSITVSQYEEAVALIAHDEDPRNDRSVEQSLSEMASFLRRLVNYIEHDHA